MFELRPYQQAAVDAAIAHISKKTNPGLLELTTGAGKSFIVAAIAHWIVQKSGKKVLCLQPSKELTEQNHEKYLLTGSKASLFSASVGSKCTRHDVVYGTPQTVKNQIQRFGKSFAAVIIDEAHGITPTIRAIISEMRKQSPNLRVIGMTATPYRMNTGYIYRYDLDGRALRDEECREPYFNDLLYRIQTRELIDQGFLTPAHCDPDIAQQYAAGGLELNRMGKFDAKQVDQVFTGQGRLTADIVADVVKHSHGRRGVMLFAASVSHAKEIMESLPQDNARMIGGDINTQGSDREKLISDFKAQKYKFIVSIGTLTTGFDAPHVDLIAILRATESPALFQQIIGRGLRLADGKADCLVLDYAENIERHQLHDDLFSPEIRTTAAPGGEMLNAACNECGYINEFKARPNPDRFAISDDGYFLDLDGSPILTETEEPQPMPAHFGRRCRGQVKSLVQAGLYEQCGYRWTLKICPECEHENDIAARRCSSCSAELVDPNEKLRLDFARVKADPYSLSTDKVLWWSAELSTSAKGKSLVVCEYATEYRTFKIWYVPTSKHPAAQAQWISLNKAVYNGHVAPDAETFVKYLSKGKAPETVTSCREEGSKFFRVAAHNLPEDAQP